MSSSILPFIPSVAFYEFATPIDNVAYWFRARWNSVEEIWHLDVLEENRTPIVMGVSIVLGAYLGRQSSHPLFLSNIFVARPSDGVQREAGFDDLGTRVLVHVFSRDEAAAEIMSSISEGSR